MEVQLFGIIAEKAGATSIDIDAGSMSELRDALRHRIPDFAMLSHAIAVDRCIVQDDRELNGSEEVAVLPPFAGG